MEAGKQPAAEAGTPPPTPPWLAPALYPIIRHTHVTACQNRKHSVFTGLLL